MSLTKADELAQKQRVISVAEFFSRNRHLLGFDNPRKALLTCVKEAVDNALDACEEADILPEISVVIYDLQNNRFRIAVEDNGPGIVEKQIPRIFAKLLYGSKFFKLSQTRGQQGIGISAAVLYGQLTTGKPAKVWSKIAPDRPAHYFELTVDTQKNEAAVHLHEEREWKKDDGTPKEHGTRIEVDLEGLYQRGLWSVDAYLLHTAIVNPHATIFYVAPDGKQASYVRVSDKLPPKPAEIKPHLHGVELGQMMKMLESTESRTLQSFLTSEFTRVGAVTAKEICENAALLPNTPPKKMSREMGEKLMQGIAKSRLLNPPTDCLSPIGEELLEKGLRKEINAEFFCSVTRPPSVYRGNPFLIEVGIAYGGDQKADTQANLLRFANRVPLLYQQGACAVSEALTAVNWKPYGLQQSGSSTPTGPVTILVHICSVWVPFTSESKEAVAHYPEIINEMRLALQDAGRRLQAYVMKRQRVAKELKKRGYIEKYIPHVSGALQEILGLSKADVEKTEKDLVKLMEKHRGKVDAEPEENEEFDEGLSLAKLDEHEEDIPAEMEGDAPDAPQSGQQPDNPAEKGAQKTEKQPDSPAEGEAKKKGKKGVQRTL